MSVFLKRSSVSSAPYPPRIVCFVCAHEGPADYPLFAEPPAHANPLTAPHFPFLLSHQPPSSCLPVAQTGGEAKACRHCYTTLMRQWEEYERARISLTRRAYWIKSADEVHFQTPLQQHQMAERLLVRLGIPLHHPAQAAVATTTAAAAGVMVAPLPPVANAAAVVQDATTATSKAPPTAAHLWGASSRDSVSKRSRTTAVSDDPVALTAATAASSGPASATATVSANAGGGGGGGADNDSALDLSSGSRERETMKSRSSAASHISAVSHHSSYQSEGAGSSNDILDLTLPDKNSSSEVCYVCGDDFRRGTLSHSLAKQLNREEPFYPSLMRHSRPPRSQPMDSSGRVQTCDECHQHLLQQWHRFEAEEVPHSDRDYQLRKRQVSQMDNATFVCYICALDYQSSQLR